MITIRKYSQDIAVPTGLPLGWLLAEVMKDIITFDLVVKESIMVYTRLTRIMGLIIGKVIFQKVSQPVAPSTLQDSYIEGDID